MTDQMNTIREQTRWPSTEEDATADSMIVHAAAWGILTHEISILRMRDHHKFEIGEPGHNVAAGVWIDTLQRAIGYAQVALILAEVQKRDRALADEVARMVWGCTDDGGALWEWAWSMLDERGIDADAVFDDARDAAPKIDAARADDTPPAPPAPTLEGLEP